MSALDLFGYAVGLALGGAVSFFYWRGRFEKRAGAILDLLRFTDATIAGSMRRTKALRTRYQVLRAAIWK